MLNQDFLRGEGGGFKSTKGFVLLLFYLIFLKITNGNKIIMTQRVVEPKEVLKTEGEARGFSYFGFNRYLTEVIKCLKLRLKLKAFNI